MQECGHRAKAVCISLQPVTESGFILLLGPLQQHTDIFVQMEQHLGTVLVGRILQMG
jgi:hypothetical protein